MKKKENCKDLNNIFVKCTCCGFAWNVRDNFLTDQTIHLIGYQASFRGPDNGLLMFNHRCDTTFSIRVSKFRDLYKGPIFTDSRKGTKDCHGFCLIEDELHRCPERCRYAYVREILQIVKNWPKKGTGLRMRGRL